MAKGRFKTGLVHKKGGEIFDISRERSTGKYFIRGTQIEVPADKLCKKGQEKNLHKQKYNKDIPWHAQELGDEWSDYAWSANDY